MYMYQNEKGKMKGNTLPNKSKWEIFIYILRKRETGIKIGVGHK